LNLPKCRSNIVAGFQKGRRQADNKLRGERASCSMRKTFVLLLGLAQVPSFSHRLHGNHSRHILSQFVASRFIVISPSQHTASKGKSSALRHRAAVRRRMVIDYPIIAGDCSSGFAASTTAPLHKRNPGGRCGANIFLDDSPVALPSQCDHQSQSALRAIA